VGNWTFRPYVSFPPLLIRRFLLIFLLIQLKPKHHRLDVLTIFQRGARGARGAVFRDTLSQCSVCHVVGLTAKVNNK